MGKQLASWASCCRDDGHFNGGDGPFFAVGEVMNSKDYRVPGEPTVPSFLGVMTYILRAKKTLHFSMGTWGSKVLHSFHKVYYHVSLTQKIHPRQQFMLFEDSQQKGLKCSSRKEPLVHLRASYCCSVPISSPRW